jgi:hypothetical protein
MIKLTGEADLQKAKAEYPMFRRWDDSSVITKLTVRGADGNKTIILNNYGSEDPDNKLHYPLTLIKLLQLAQDARERDMGILRPIPNISYCELLKHRERYLGKTVEVYANLEYHANVLANLQVTNEREWLNDPECDIPAMGSFRTAESIGVGYLGDSATIEGLRGTTRRVRSMDYGGRGRLLLVGKLAETGEQVPGKLALRFDVTQVKKLERVILPFEGAIKLGWFYSDTFQGGKDIVLSVPLKMPRHHAATIEWENAATFPVLQKRGLRSIVFRAMSDTIKMVEKGRWNTVYHCEIVEAK